MGVDLTENLKNHRDTLYINEVMSEVLSDALSECYTCRPEDPIDYIAHYLLNHKKILHNKEKFLEKIEDRERLARRLEEEKEIQEKELMNSLKSDEAYSNLEKEFFERVKTAEDTVDLSNELCNHISIFVGATGSQIQEQKNKLKLSSNTDKMEESVLADGFELRVIASDDEHAFMFEHSLPIDSSVTGHFFAEEFVEQKDETQEVEEKNEEEKEEEVLLRKNKIYFDDEDPELKDIETPGDQEERFNTIFIPQVISDKKITFFRVPKLGCQYGIGFELSSCLNLESLETAQNDMQDLLREKATNEEIKQKQEEAVKLWMETKQGDKPDDPVQEPEKVKPFVKVTRKMALVIDSLGQDRIFTAAQREQVRRVVRIQKKQFEKAEENHLSECCDILMQQNDPALRKEFEAEFKVLKERAVIDIGPELPYENEHKEVFYAQEAQRNLLLEEKQWNLFADIKNMKVIKFMQIFTSIFQIQLGLSKEEINIKDNIYGVTNTLDWQTHRRWLESRLQDAIKSYNPRGSRPEAVQGYRRLQVIEEQLNELVDEEINKFSWLMTQQKQLLNWLIKCRKVDVDYRHKVRAIKMEEIEKLREELAEWQRRKEAHLEAGEEFTEVFDKPIPPIPEVEVDMDLLELEQN